MGDDPIPLRKVERVPHAGVVEMLETLLVEAKDGRINQFAYIVDYATAYRQGEVGKGDKMQLLGEAVCLVIGMALNIRETAKDSKP